MAYNRLAIPRIYTCTLRHLIARGTLPSAIISVAQGTKNTGADERNLICGSPLKRTSFDTSGHVATHLLIPIEVPAGESLNFLAILNHNLAQAEGFIKLLHHTSAITALNYGSATVVTITRVVGAKDEAADVEVNNGSTVATFDTVSTKLHWALEIADHGNFSATNLQIGAILLGNYWTAPFAPDEKSWKPDTEFGVKLHEGDGPARAAHIAWSTGDESSAWPFGQPFRNDGLTAVTQRHGGRRIWPVSIPTLADTSIFQSDLSDGIGASACWQDVISRTAGAGIPCIFGLDSTSAIPGDYMWGRLVKRGAPVQSFAAVYNLDFTVEEEF